MMKKLTLTILPISLLLLLSFSTSLVMAEELPTLRYGEPIDQEVSPSPIPKVIDDDVRS